MRTAAGLEGQLGTAEGPRKEVVQRRRQPEGGSRPLSRGWTSQAAFGERMTGSRARGHGLEGERGLLKSREETTAPRSLSWCMKVDASRDQAVVGPPVSCDVPASCLRHRRGVMHPGVRGQHLDTAEDRPSAFPRKGAQSKPILALDLSIRPPAYSALACQAQAGPSLAKRRAESQPP